jgi:hypothetical protein
MDFDFEDSLISFLSDEFINFAEREENRGGVFKIETYFIVCSY